MKKVKLNKKNMRLTLKEKILKLDSSKMQIEPEETPVYYSNDGIMKIATDDQNFILFDVPKTFLIDNGFNNILDFRFDNELWMLIDQKTEIIPHVENSKVTFGDFGNVDKRYYDLISTLTTLNYKYFIITEWFGRASNRLVICLPDKGGKPIGILKLVK